MIFFFFFMIMDEASVMFTHVEMCAVNVVTTDPSCFWVFRCLLVNCELALS